MKKLSIKLIIPILIILALAWFFRPFFHPFFMSFVISPLKFILIIFIALGIWSLVKKAGKIKIVQTGQGSYGFKSANHIPGLSVASYVILFIVIIFGLAIESEARAYLTSKQVTFESRQDLPEFNKIRLTPKPVATRYAADSFQSPQETLADSQIALVDGKLVRVFPRVPDGGLLYFINKMSGFVTVEVDTLDRKVNIQNQEFKYSDHIGITDNLYFQLLKKKYFVSYSAEPIYLKDNNNKWITVVPYMSYKKFPFRVPYWAGVMIVKSDGTITDYTPEAAQKLTYLKGNRLYPKELTNYYTAAYSYKGGLINKWLLHKNQIEIVSLPGEETIIHASTKEGFKQIVVAEPYGRSYGVYKIFIIDATTGKREIISYDQNSQLTGPISAADYIKRAFPTYNWTNFQLSEPRPVKVNGDLNWLLSIIPNDSAGIATTVLLDAKTNKVVEVKTENELQLLLSGHSEAAVEESRSSDRTQTPPTTNSQLPAAKNAQIQQKIDTIQSQLDELKNLVK